MFYQCGVAVDTEDGGGADFFECIGFTCLVTLQSMQAYTVWHTLCKTDLSLTFNKVFNKNIFNINLHGPHLSTVHTFHNRNWRVWATLLGFIKMSQTTYMHVFIDHSHIIFVCS